MIILKKLIIISVLILFSILIIVSFFNNNFEKASDDLSENTRPTIIVDAGHGGFDGGASTEDGVPEKGINLSIALYLREYLNFLGFDVIMTREADVSTEDDGLNTIRSRKSSDLHNRMSLMEDTENSIFVSIHQNHFSSSKYNGAQVFYSENFSEISSGLAQNIQDSIVKNLQPDNNRKIKICDESVFLIYNAVRPAVLVECGFLSNFEEAERLKTADYQKKLAFSIALGILNYYEGQ